MKFTLQSISDLITKSLETVKRFPLVVLCAVIGTVFGIWYADLSFSDQKNYVWLSDLIAISFLGISFLFAINMYAESKKWTYGKGILAGVVGIIILALYYFLPSEYISSGLGELGYRFFLLAFTSHLWVSFSPFINNGRIEDFWEYNKTLFLTILTSALYSAVLFAGLSVALLSIDNLLGFDIDDESYFQLWIFIVGVFNTLFFLSRVPYLTAVKGSHAVYPKPLKVFVQYVLIPLVTVYILILYSYLIKIIAQWELPTGWVANLVLSFSIAGIFSLLLLHPIKDEVKNNWIRLYSKLYYIALVPLVVLLFVSIGTRISEYGVTINRFLVATLAVWLAGIVIYFIFSKAKNIKVIPISLAVIALGISFGPMSAFSVSERSQKGRMTGILDSNNLLNENGKILKSEAALEFNDRAEISSIVRYMIDNHDVRSLQSWFADDLRSKIDSIKTDDLDFRTQSEKVVLLMGFEYVNEWENELTDSLNQSRYFEYTAESKTGVDISGYEFSFNGLRFYTGTPEVRIIAKERVLKLDPNLDEYAFTIKTKDGKELIRISFSEMIINLQKNYPTSSANIRIPTEVMTVKTENDQVTVMMVFHTAYGNSGVDRALNNTQFTLYLNFKE